MSTVVPQARQCDGPRLSVIMPARSEDERIGAVLDGLFDAVHLPCEVLVVVDSADDSTVPVVAAYAETEPRLACLVSGYGPGPANAIRFGMDAAAGAVLVVMMADGSDDPAEVDRLARLVERGVAVAAASRYMPGGRQLGGPLLKRLLSRAAGRSLQLLARPGTCDATNSFKAYSAAFVRAAGVESRRGFEIGIELTAKARRQRLPVAEIPTIWLDQPGRDSGFRLVSWLPGYLRWYLFCLGRRRPVSAIRPAAAVQSAARGGH
jgi:dolichol-phosphate mannosyltransferase